MKVLDLVNFLKTPADRDVIARWTAPPGPRGYALDLPAPPDPERFAFLVLGDSGDSAGMGAVESPQDAVAQYLARDAALPGCEGDGQFVLHTGDVVYMAGEQRLYDRNFRRPYSAFLTPESTVENLVFRLPFLPVPGNHDYYDFAGWATTLARTPILGAGVAALARELFAFQIPVGGSDMGGAYMRAFVDPEMGRNGSAYEPGTHTRIPNRYYRFRVGQVDFFALDSNTLESPPPSEALERDREDAERQVKQLERRARALSRQIRRDEEAIERWLAGQRAEITRDRGRLDRVRQAGETLGGALERLAGVLRRVEKAASAGEPAGSAEALAARWTAALRALKTSKRSEGRERALEALDEAGDDSCELLEAVEGCFTVLPEGPERRDLLAAKDEVILGSRAWRDAATGLPPGDLCARMKRLSAEALDVQRHLALERRRAGRRPEDYDRDQFEWLREGLEESARERPDGWRIVFLHQPLYTTIGNHSENFDVVGVRENLAPLLRDHVHLVLAGHSHAFEWFRSSLVPTTALVVTGGGGQPWLWRSILDPRRFRHFRNLYRSLCQGGATECAIAGQGPPAFDREAGPLYHYLRVEVTPEALLVRPVGVRRVTSGYRRECPMPVYHVPELSAQEPLARPPWKARMLEGIEVRRGERPRLRWG